MASRDFRSEQKDIKRHKDQSMKWANGDRVNPRHIFTDKHAAEGADVHQPRVRPEKRWSEIKGERKLQANFVKSRNHHSWNVSKPRFREFQSTHEELQNGSSRSIVDLVKEEFLSGSGTLTSPSNSSILYSFDNTDTPPPTLALDAFVKTSKRPTPTDKLIEKEYEVVDDNGDAVRGRKARQVLRKAASGATATSPPRIEVVDEEDFELV